MTDGRTRRREDTRQRLFVAAVELIAEQGFSATTVDDIAARAGVAAGTAASGRADSATAKAKADARRRSERIMPRK